MYIRTYSSYIRTHTLILCPFRGSQRPQLSNFYDPDPQFAALTGINAFLQSHGLRMLMTRSDDSLFYYVKDLNDLKIPVLVIEVKSILQFGAQLHIAAVHKIHIT